MGILEEKLKVEMMASVSIMWRLQVGVLDFPSIHCLLVELSKLIYHVARSKGYTSWMWTTSELTWNTKRILNTREEWNLMSFDIIDVMSSLDRVQ